MFRRLLCVFALVLLALTSMLAGCARPEPPRVTPRSIRVTSVTATEVGLAIELEVYNPNGFALWLRNARGTLSVGNGIEVGTGEASIDGQVPPKASTVVPAALSMGWSNVQALVPLALSAAKVPYVFRGTARIGSEQLNLDLPITVQGELTRAQVLQAGLNGLPSL